MAHWQRVTPPALLFMERARSVACKATSPSAGQSDARPACSALRPKAHADPRQLKANPRPARQIPPDCHLLIRRPSHTHTNAWLLPIIVTDREYLQLSLVPRQHFSSLRNGWLASY